ncbi:hypothetical protein G6031_04420 [Dietzia sp. CQ4]|uniref:hypothetical protein n=1 Tax=Dietzia sp. (strain CQ4) TaxID=370437 RepID=UPI0015FD746B|nr:hypothetical protein [Dietzia sp. CQ4]MBB1033632.1 hypothetical protein [Dietzia sp. CQ4]
MNDSGSAGLHGADGPPPRGLQTVVYVATTALGGIGALVVATVELLSPEAGTFDVLLWSALAVLLLAAAARRWWFGASGEDRSRRIASELGADEVAEAVQASSGEVDAVRRLRVAHPGLGLRDAVDLVRRDGSNGRSVEGRRSGSG